MSITNLVPSGYYTNDVKNYATPQEWEAVLRALPEGGTIKIPCMGDIYTFRMVGKGQDKLADDRVDSNLVSFICEELYAGSSFVMNFTNTNDGGWFQCAGREFIHSLLSTFPEALQAAIKTTVKTSGAGHGKGAIISAYDKLWIPSATELYGNIPAGSWSVEGTQYNYYRNIGITTSNNSALIKRILSGGQSAYRLRSPYLPNTIYFGYVSPSGTLTNYNATMNACACVGFCV